MGWTRDYDLDMLIEDMMSQDLKLFERDKYLMEGGHSILKQAE